MLKLSSQCRTLGVDGCVFISILHSFDRIRELKQLSGFSWDWHCSKTRAHIWVDSEMSTNDSCWAAGPVTMFSLDSLHKGVFHSGGDTRHCAKRGPRALGQSRWQNKNSLRSERFNPLKLFTNSVILLVLSFPGTSRGSLMLQLCVENKLVLFYPVGMAK